MRFSVLGPRSVHADLREGAFENAPARLLPLAERNPLRERPHEQLGTALYGSGRARPGSPRPHPRPGPRSDRRRAP